MLSSLLTDEADVELLKRYRWTAAGALCGLAVLAALLFLARTREVTSADLTTSEPADKRAVLPMPEAFVVTRATIGGVSKPAIFTQPESRFTWTYQIPRNAWFQVSLALREDAWTLPGDGVLFRVGIAGCGPYDELSNRVVNPYGVSGDRRWLDVTLDLSSYADKTCNIILSTNASAPGAPVNRDHDFAYWGAPRIIVR